MLVRWYYRTKAGDVGPISAAELKYLIDAGTIAPSTLVRQGSDGPWLTAGEIDGSLIAAQGGREADNFAGDDPAWHFNPKGQSKQGPVSSSVLKAMVAEGKLQSDDLVWKPGMALWVPASRIQGLTNELVDPKVSDPSVRVRIRHSAHPGVRRGALVVLALLVLLAGAVAWKWAAIGSSERPVTDAGGSRSSTEKGGTARDDLGGVEPLFVEARTAVRLEQFERATRTLNQYLASPLARQADAAKVLLREIALATSASEAALVASNLGDAPLKNYLQNGVDLLVAALETPELRPIYERTLLRAFRQESNRRQMVPRGAIAQNPMPAAAEPDPLVSPLAIPRLARTHRPVWTAQPFKVKIFIGPRVVRVTRGSMRF
jgi:GYF domain 2